MPNSATFPTHPISTVLPPILSEGNFRPFKFWFNDRLQDGLFYQNELFFRLQTLSVTYRATLYQHACQLAQRDSVIVTASPTEYTIWISLHSPRLSHFVQELEIL
mgnify:CR=1 FL=1